MTRIVKDDNEVHIYDEKDNLVGYGGITKESPLSSVYMKCFEYRCNYFFSTLQAISYYKMYDCLSKYGMNSDLFYMVHPADCKALADRVWSEKRKIKKRTDDLQWLRTIERILPWIIREKFTRIPELRTWLISTGNAYLAQIAQEGEQSYHNTYWGLSIGCSHPDIDKPYLWHKYGNNFIGRTLMDIRSELILAEYKKMNE